MNRSFDSHWTDEEIDDLLDEGAVPNSGDRLFHLLLCFSCQDLVRVRDPERGPSRLARLFGSEHPLPATAADQSYFEELEDLLEPWRARIDQALVEVRAASGLLVELLRVPPERRRLLATNTRRYRTLGVVAALLERVPDLWVRDPPDAHDLSELALAILQRIPRDRYRDRVINDFFARAWSYLGNSRRILSNLLGAERAFERALRYLENGSGDPLDTARVFDLESALRRDQRKYVDAECLLEMVVEIARSVEMDDLEVKALIQQSLLYREMGKPLRALRTAEELFDRFTPEELGPTYHLCALHNRALIQVGLGRVDAAREGLPALRTLAAVVRADFYTIRIDWLEGLLMHHLGRYREAESAYRKTRAFFIERAVAYDAALVTLDLITLLLEQRRTAEVRELSAEVLPIFVTANVAPEALAAIRAFRQALDADTAQAALAREISCRLGELRSPPAVPAHP